MSEMIERVAREMFFAMHPDAEWSAGRARMKWFALAEVAITAMREPTDAQFDSLTGLDKMWRHLNSREVYQAFIDGALK